ncbi:MAG: class I SAM-dependent methyltransferase [Isosphaerales bacterium]
MINVQASYDRVAAEYVQRIFDELKHKPLDRQLLDRFAARMMGVGSACDLGCGPGQVARYLHERNVQVSGIDLSPVMVGWAQKLNPGIEFRQGDMLSLDIEDGTWDGVAAFYSIIHIPRSKVVEAFGEIKRVLRPGGLLLLAFHIGDDVLHVDEWWGLNVSVDFVLFRPEEMRGFLESAGFTVEEIIEREPYPVVEHQSRRAYLFARKP